MKKQGPPPPLDESLVTKKRKNVQAEVANGRSKKRRTAGKQRSTGSDRAAGRIQTPRSKDDETKLLVETQDKTGRVGSRNRNGQLRKPVEDEKESFESTGEPEAELGVRNGVVQGKKQKKAENFMGFDSPDDDSDGPDLGEDEFEDFGSDVVDSDTEGPKNLWSEDEDDEDAEQKLTVANIEGLSRQLDLRQAKEAEDAQAELADAGLQTNIAGDSFNISGDESEEGGLKAKVQLAPDLQLLRSRITETVRGA